MNDLTSSVWRSAFIAALLEASAARMAIRVVEARAAINERLDSRVEITPDEHQALHAALQKLATLKVQHVDLIKPIDRQYGSPGDRTGPETPLDIAR